MDVQDAVCRNGKGSIVQNKGLFTQTDAHVAIEGIVLCQRIAGLGIHGLKQLQLQVIIILAADTIAAGNGSGNAHKIVNEAVVDEFAAVVGHGALVHHFRAGLQMQPADILDLDVAVVFQPAAITKSQSAVQQQLAALLDMHHTAVNDVQ